jgi:hypothetical protein
MTMKSDLSYKGISGWLVAAIKAANARRPKGSRRITHRDIAAYVEDRTGKPFDHHNLGKSIKLAKGTPRQLTANEMLAISEFLDFR